MEGKTREFDIKARTFRFAVDVVRLGRVLPRGVAGSVISRQIIRAGTSVGANVEEAQGAPSRKDFARRMNIARSEAREVHYWLRVLRETGILGSTGVNELIQEANELVSVLTAIVKRSREEKTIRD